MEFVFHSKYYIKNIFSKVICILIFLLHNICIPDIPTQRIKSQHVPNFCSSFFTDFRFCQKSFCQILILTLRCNTRSSSSKYRIYAVFIPYRRCCHLNFSGKLRHIVCKPSHIPHTFKHRGCATLRHVSIILFCVETSSRSRYCCSIFNHAKHKI